MRTKVCTSVCTDIFFSNQSKLETKNLEISATKTHIWALLKSWYPYVIDLIITAWFLMYI